ncbi:MAG: DUF116 domain-containing protein [Candidatus Aenigmatarchaeota archaeon]
MSMIIKKLVGLGIDLSTKKALKKALSVIGIKPDNIDSLYIELKNSINEGKFKETPVEKKIVFIPQCLRKSDTCKARVGKNGYECTKCSNTCKARKVKDVSESLGYRTYIVPGGSMIQKIIINEKPQAVMGVACIKELVMAFDGIKIPVQGVKLLKEGCINTDVDMDEFGKALGNLTKRKDDLTGI